MSKIPCKNEQQDSLPNAITNFNAYNWTTLHEAAAEGDDKKLSILLVGNANRGVKELKLGNTPLHEAAWRGFSRCVKLLCSPKSNNYGGHNCESSELISKSILNAKNNDGFTPLHFAAQNGHNQSCRELLLAGADHYIQNNYGDTPLHTACRYGHAGAVRILLSASCNPNIINLNGDTPLHITCAMGRRKLTRILLNTGSVEMLTNSQDETPYDIAVRKNYREIVEILTNTPVRRSKEPANRTKLPKTVIGNSTKVEWSPYGCHYFPDPRNFPPPKLETLPKEPLKCGEQYYIDLSGHIRKGPIGVANACYCGPFFRHIENKLHMERKSLRRYVHRAKERLGHKVQAIAVQTNKQIEELTRSIVADRIRCENKRIYLSNCLNNRNAPNPVFAEFHGNQRVHVPGMVLPRCRSLEILNHESLMRPPMFNSKSCNLLNETEAPADSVHSASFTREKREPEMAAVSLVPESDDKLHTNYIPVGDEDSISERLGNLLTQTKLILENDTDNYDNTNVEWDFKATPEPNPNGDIRVKHHVYNGREQPNSYRFYTPNVDGINLQQHTMDAAIHQESSDILKNFSSPPEDESICNRIPNESQEIRPVKYEDYASKNVGGIVNRLNYKKSPLTEVVNAHTGSLVELGSPNCNNENLKHEASSKVQWKRNFLQNVEAANRKQYSGEGQRIEIRNSEIKLLSTSGESEGRRRGKVHEMVNLIQENFADNQNLLNVMNVKNTSQKVKALPIQLLCEVENNNNEELGQYNAHLMPNKSIFYQI